MSKFARENIKRLKPYVPGEQPAAHVKIIKLNTNENPYPPAPAVKKVLRKFPLERLRRYPEPEADTFRRTVAKVLEVRPEMIIAGNGADELINVAIRTFVQPDQTIAYPVPTYSLYPVLARIQEAKVGEVPFGRGFDLPDQLFDIDAKLIFVCNPNAPSGTFIDPAKIEQLARSTQALVVIDEAYVDFADENCLKLTKRNPNVIVLRTLSKGYGLAGLRFGFAIGPPELIGDMLKVKDSYNCDALALATATKAIEDQKYFAETVAKIRGQRMWLAQKLESLGFVTLPSHANFIWAEINRPPAGQVYLRLKRRGILVRYFEQPRLKRGLRITVGRPGQNKTLIRALSEILAKTRKKGI